jgi:hypothetical protein
MKDEIKEIISIYNAILENKDVLIKEATDVYDDVDFKDNVVGNSTPSKDTINLALLQDVQTAAKNAGLKVDITTAVSGHRPSQRHDAGNAVDISKINGKSVSLSNRSDADKLVDALIKMGYIKNKEGSSNPKSVLTFGFEGHDNHVHVSNTTTTQSSSTDDILSVDDKSKGPTNDAWANMIGNVLSSTLNLKESSNFNDYMYIEYCGIKTPKVRKGDSISKGETIGTTDTDVDVFIYNSSKNKDYISAHISKDFIGKNVSERSGRFIIPGGNTQKIKSPKDGEVSGEIYNSACVNQIVIKYEKDSTLNKQQDDGKNKINTTTKSALKGEKESDIVKFLFDKKYRKELGNIVKGRDKSYDEDKPDIKPDREKGWLNKYFDKISTTKKVQENVNRIKGLLK